MIDQSKSRMKKIIGLSPKEACSEDWADVEYKKKKRVHPNSIGHLKDSTTNATCFFIKQSDPDYFASQGVEEQVPLYQNTVWVAFYNDPDGIQFVMTGQQYLSLIRSYEGEAPLMPGRRSGYSYYRLIKHEWLKGDKDDDCQEELY